jgi:hypothetical protein
VINDNEKPPQPFWILDSSPERKEQSAYSEAKDFGFFSIVYCLMPDACCLFSLDHLSCLASTFCTKHAVLNVRIGRSELRKEREDTMRGELPSSTRLEELCNFVSLQRING